MSDIDEDNNNKRKRIDNPDSPPELPEPKKPQKMTTLESLAASIERLEQRLSKKIDENAENLETKFVAVETIVKEVKDGFVAMREEVFNMQIKVNKQELLINQLEQDALSDSFNVFGLPALTGNKADPIPIIQKILSKIGVESSPEEFKTCFHIQHRSGKGSHISATCWDERKKREILQKARDFNKVPNQKILVEEIVQLPKDSPARGRQLFIKNQMTEINAKINNEARKYRKKIFEYVWEKDGRTMIRVNADSKAHYIRSLQQLEHFVNEAKQQMEH